LLRRLHFDEVESALGALALLFCTTYLWHCQNNQENPLQLALVLAGADSALAWMETRRKRSLVKGLAFAAAGLLVRVTMIVDFAAVMALPWLTLSFEGGDRKARREYLRAAAPIAAAVLLVVASIDRAYQWARFGTLSGTYISLFGKSFRAIYPWLPPTFPFTFPPLWGSVAPFVSPAKCLFLYDPMLSVTAVVAIVSWRRLDAAVKALLLAESLGLVLSAVGISRMWCSGGDEGWGDRYLSVAVHALALLAIPLACRLVRASSRPALARRTIVGVTAVAALLQVASLLYPCWMETCQSGDEGWPRPYLDNWSYLDFRLGLRLENIVGHLTGHAADWGLVRVMRDGSIIGPTTFFCLPSQPLESSSRAIALGVHTAWWVLFVATIVGLGLLLRRLRAQYGEQLPAASTP
jgi:hypothetical protein